MAINNVRTELEITCEAQAVDSVESTLVSVIDLGAGPVESTAGLVAGNQFFGKSLDAAGLRTTAREVKSAANINRSI